jgi:hypothetical protein
LTVAIAQATAHLMSALVFRHNVGSNCGQAACAAFLPPALLGKQKWQAAIALRPCCAMRPIRFLYFSLFQSFSAAMSLFKP